MRNKKQLLVEKLDQKLKKFKAAEEILVPEKGWINYIRTTINMTRDQLGQKTHLTKGAIQKIEERESTGQISINKLEKIGEALNLRLIYGFIPNDGSIEKMVSKKANELAKKIVLRTNQNMKLENQGISNKNINQSIEDLASEIKRELRKTLWD